MNSSLRLFIGLAVLSIVSSALQAQTAGIPAKGAARNSQIKWINEPKPGVLPTGVVHRTFFSKALGREVG